MSHSLMVDIYSQILAKNFAGLLSSIIKRKQNLKQPVCNLDKSLLAGLLKMCGSDKERDLLCYTAVKSSCLSATQAYKQLGLQNMDQRITKVDNVVEHAKFIWESIDMLAITKDRAFLKSVGITDQGTSSSEDDLATHSIMMYI